MSKNTQDGITLHAGDKVKFIIEGIGTFIGYIKYHTAKAISMKGCRLVDIHDSAYSMNNVDVSYYRKQQNHTFLVRDFAHMELLEKTPF